ncbi:recombinase family protein, partial [Streptomyces scabiei]|uniref:recombinase family protein n=2 Tax=Streptomyces TaxID=1883 RepID=UPI0029B569FF
MRTSTSANARCSTLGQELNSQLDALSKHGIPRGKIFSEKISTRVRVRPRFEKALRTAREVKAHAPHCRVIFTVYEMKRLGRDAAELTALTDHLTAHGLVLEMLAGPLPGIYDPTGPGKLLFAFFAAMAETERENIRESTLEGLDTAARKGKHGGRPPAMTDDMLHTVLRRRAGGESVGQIQPDLFIPTGKRKGHKPSVRYLSQDTWRKCRSEPPWTKFWSVGHLGKRRKPPRSRLKTSANSRTVWVSNWVTELLRGQGDCKVVVISRICRSRRYDDAVRVRDLTQRSSV